MTKNEENKECRVLKYNMYKEKWSTNNKELRKLT